MLILVRGGQEWGLPPSDNNDQESPVIQSHNVFIRIMDRVYILTFSPQTSTKFSQQIQNLFSGIRIFLLE